MKNYEKKYKDLVKAVKELQEANPSDEGIQNWVNENVPELAESEGERIRKEIIQVFKGEISFTSEKENEKYIAWLEKQKPDEWSEEDEKRLESIIEECSFHKGRYKHGIEESAYYTLCEKNISWLKSLKDRINWKPSEEQIGALEHFVRSIGESGFASPYESNTNLVYSLLSELKKLKG